MTYKCLVKKMSYFIFQEFYFVSNLSFCFILHFLFSPSTFEHDGSGGGRAGVGGAGGRGPGGWGGLGIERGRGGNKIELVL